MIFTRSAALSLCAALSFSLIPRIQASHFNTDDLATTYHADYIIVGVGTAGAVLARKLTDDKKTSVIALHSGANLSNDSLIKYSSNAIYTVLLGLLSAPLPVLPPPLDQKFQKFLTALSPIAPPLYESGLTIPQVDADNRELFWVLALPSGGASSINAGAWCRGTNQVYAQWEAIAGPEWSVNQILEIYKQLENYHGTTTNPSSRGYGGLVNVRQSYPLTRLSSKFSKATINATGFPFLADYNDPNTPLGVSPQVQVTQNGTSGKLRVSSASAFLGKKVMKPNGRGVDNRKLRVFFNSPALKTIWNGNTATGVEFVQGGVTKTATANKGVIVCAGLRSSAFLMNSGVGPSAVLAPLGIPVIYDNPNVGQALADQPHVVMFFASNPADTPVDPHTLFSQIAWLPTPGGDQTSRQVRIAIVNTIPGLTIGILDLCQPYSRGSITINSADPLATPVLNLGVLSDSRDLDIFEAAFATYVKQLNLALQAIDPLYQLIFPDPAILDDPALLTAFIQAEVGSNMHFQSHCRMAPLNQGGVVDSTGRVYGVNNLFVADDSIVPQCMDGSPMASAYLIAFNIARMLKSEQ
jgi:choline dehydrogenase-like flavoprotein